MILSPEIQIELLGNGAGIPNSKWYADGTGGFGINQTLPYLSTALDVNAGTGSNRYVSYHSSFIATEIVQNGSTIEVQGATLADLATLSFSNGFGETISGTAGSATTATVHAQNSVFSFWKPEPITLEVYTSAELVNGVLTTTRANVTFSPSMWIRYNTKFYVFGPCEPLISTVPNVAAEPDGVLGFHNAEIFFMPSENCRVIEYPNLSLHRPTLPAGASPDGERFCFYTGDASPVVCGMNAAEIASRIQYGITYWPPAHAEILFQ